ncbi:MAG: metallophosphoesterase [Myxococcales bacterium]|nr:MAG: metallophosphoesterase [Myxococcales bacterium]
MRTAIISDIHANYEALSAVLEIVERLKTDRCVCLGDLVGYGASPNESVQAVRERAEFSILGNHDAAIVGRMSLDFYYDTAREALEWTAQSLTPENDAYLRSLPYVREERDICWVHGEPERPEAFNYVYTLPQARRLAGAYERLKPVTFVGHSHLRRVFVVEPNGALELPTDNLTLNAERKYVVAVGSVGQPRDNDPRAAFAIFDEQTRRVEFYRVDYDVDRAAEKILKAGLPQFFAHRLYSGA